jgi:hypothetical protein
MHSKPGDGNIFQDFKLRDGELRTVKSASPERLEW